MKRILNVFLLLAGMAIVSACADNQVRTASFHNPSSANKVPAPGYMYK